MFATGHNSGDARRQRLSRNPFLLHRGLWSKILPNSLSRQNRRAEPVGYIGGTTPFFSTRIRCALNAPPAAAVAVTIAFFPAVRSERSAGMNATTGTFAGTVTVLLPPLYESCRT